MRRTLLLEQSICNLYGSIVRINQNSETTRAEFRRHDLFPQRSGDVSSSCKLRAWAGRWIDIPTFRPPPNAAGAPWHVSTGILFGRMGQRQFLDQPDRRLTNRMPAVRAKRKSVGLEATSVFSQKPTSRFCELSVQQPVWAAAPFVPSPCGAWRRF
jgi:hypothetical protein